MKNEDIVKLFANAPAIESLHKNTLNHDQTAMLRQLRSEKLLLDSMFKKLSRKNYKNAQEFLDEFWYMIEDYVDTTKRKIQGL